MNNRDSTLDLAKGILIILVVLGHSIQYSFGQEWLSSLLFFDDVVFKTIYSFHMPLFMLISGYLFYNSNKKDLKPLVISKLKAIGIPMLSFILLYKALPYVELLLDGDILGPIKDYIRTVVFGMIMWFLLSLLLNMAVLAILTRLVKRKELQYLVMAALFVASFFIPDSVVLGVHKFMFPFFCIGYIIKQSDLNIYASSSKFIRMGLLTVLSVASIIWFDRNTYIYTSGFCILGDPCYHLLIDVKRIIIALVVSYTFMQYVHLLVSKRNIITEGIIRLGQMSLFIYGLNMVFNTYYSRVLSYWSLNFDFNYILPIVVTSCFILVSYYLYRLLDKSKITRIVFLGK